MTTDKAISEHYRHGNLVQAIHEAVIKLGKAVEEITIEDLAPVDEFHIGGRVATEHLLNQADFTNHQHILDVGCGLGGAARFVASRYGARVSGIDLTQEYVDTGNTLCAWTGLDRRVFLHHGSATAMPFEEASFDGAYMLHVGMNIEDKALLFREVARVLRPGGRFCVYDIMRTGEGELMYPVPWASTAGTSKLATPDHYRRALEAAGFRVDAEANRRDFALAFFRELKAKAEAAGGPPPLGLHTLMKESTPAKIKNMIDNIAAGYIAPVEIIARHL